VRHCLLRLALPLFLLLVIFLQSVCVLRSATIRLRGSVGWDLSH
jgi:hypothetical protein